MKEGPDGSAGRSLTELAQDWLTIWQSELAAAADDHEWREAYTWHINRCAQCTAGTQAAALAPSGFASPARPAQTPPSAGSAPVAAAPDARDAAIRQLAKRMEKLERRLAGLELTRRP